MQISKTVKLLGTVTLIGITTGCASMFGDNTRQVTVNSQPSGAGIYMDGVRHGTTPAIITLPSHIYGGKVISLRKDGYLEQSATINSKFQPVGLWNILFWPGFIIDGVTGDTVKIDPSSLVVSTNLETAASANKKK
jgi:hypothetical protein